MSQLENLVDRKISLIATLSFGDIINGIEDEKDAIDLIKAIDLGLQDGDFTISLIKELFKSLRNDFDQEEGKELIKELKKLNKSIA